MRQQHTRQVTDAQWAKIIEHFPSLGSAKSLLVALTVNFIETISSNNRRNEFSLKARKSAYLQAQKHLAAFRSSMRGVLAFEEAVIELSVAQMDSDPDFNFVALAEHLEGSLSKFDNCLNQGIIVNEEPRSSGPDKEPAHDYISHVADIFEQHELGDRIGAGRDSHSMLNFVVDLCRCLDYAPQRRALADEIRSWKKNHA